MAYAGFDTYGFPGVPLLQRLKTETNLTWIGYYLHSPSQPATSWRGKRAAIASVGLGFAPIYVGQQVIGPGSHLVNGLQGANDGVDARVQMVIEGFPRGSWVYLDLENGPPFGQAQKDYVAAWIDEVEKSGFHGGVYCSFLFASQVHALRPNARLWVFHVKTTDSHPVAGSRFPEIDPANSGYPFATMWQHDDTADLTAYGLTVDLDTSTIPDPSAGDATPAVVTVPLPVAVASPSLATVKALQAALNGLGASPALIVDGLAGKLTIAAMNQALAKLQG